MQSLGIDFEIGRSSLEAADELIWTLDIGVGLLPKKATETEVSAGSPVFKWGANPWRVLTDFQILLFSSSLMIKDVPLPPEVPMPPLGTNEIR